MKKILTTFSALLLGLSGMAQHSFFYDTFDPDDTSIKVVTDTYTLDACTEYLITVEGSYSIWAANNWATSCGPTDPSPIFPTPGVTNGTVGFDFEYIFGINNSSHALCGSLELPTTRMEISLDGGLSWSHPTVDVVGYNPAHIYTYTIMGGGNPIQVRHISTANADDYGQLEFTIEEIPVDACDFDLNFEANRNGCSMDFNGAGSFPCSNSFAILGESWDFGDGNTSSDTNPSHTYASSGTYIVTYTVWATNGEECCTKEITREISVDACNPCEEILPAVNFMFSLSGGTLTYNETGIASFDVSDLPIGYVWDFGDGTKGSGTNGTHTYAANGTYTVCLTVFYQDPSARECCSNQICYDVVVGDVAERRATGNSNSTVPTMEELNSTVLYPNPSDGNVTLTLENDYIENVVVYDNMGRIVHTSKKSNGNNVRLELSKLNSGMYNVVTEGISGKRYTSKLILE